MDIAAWLRGLGLEHHERVFRENAIDADVLHDLTDEHLKQLGLPLGHRLKLIKAIAALDGSAPSHPPSVSHSPGTAAAPSAERRQLTVMFCDLVGSTALSTRLDPEDLREVIAAYHECVAGVVGRFEAFLAKYMGDGVLVYFGWPKTHEDEPERAVHAGLAVIEAVRRLHTPDGEPMVCRVGVATGLVVVGKFVGYGAAQEEAVVGETPNRAARLQQLAGPGQVVIAESTRQLVGDFFEIDEMGPQHLKGLGSGLGAFRVVAERSGIGRFEAHQPHKALPMFGRDHELAVLLDRWHLAKTGEGQGVLLVGEAGAGKSRLFRALQDACPVEPRTQLIYQCSPLHMDSALWPFVQQLSRAAAFARDDTDTVRLEKLEALLQKGVDPPGEAVPLLATLLGIDTGERYPALELTPQQRRIRTFQALMGQLLGLAAQGPVLVLFEDVHWIDPTSLELVEAVLARIGREAVLMLLTSRPEGQPSIAGHPHMTRLTLSRLGRDHAETIVNQLAGKPLPREVLARIVEQTDGIPLFIEELTRTVLGSGLLQQAETADGPLPHIAIPASLHDSLMARLDQLQPVKEVAQTAACIGREFSHDLLAAVSPLSEVQLRGALDQLIAAELVFRHGAPPKAHYTFKHALVRDAAYQSLLRSRRVQLHRRIAEALREHRGTTGDTQPELLAWHYTLAGLPELAIEQWRLAGEHSVACFANREAISHFGRAQDLLQALALGAERDRLEADLCLAKVVPLIAINGFGSQAVEVCATRANELSDAPVESPRRFAARRVVWNSSLLRQPVPKTVALARDLLAIADRDGDPARRAVACRALGYSLFIAGEQVEADPLLNQGIVISEDLPDSEFAIYGEHPQIVCRLYQGQVRWMLGFPDSGLHIAQEGLARARARCNPHVIAWSLVCVGDIHEYRREALAAERLGSEGISISREHHLPQWLAFSQRIRGWALCQLGETQEGLELLEDSLRRLHATGAVLHTSRIHGLLAQCYEIADSPEAARDHLAAAYRHSDVYGERYFVAELHRQDASLLQSEGAPARSVEEHLSAALAVARSQRSKSLELRAATQLARLWRGQGRRDEAHGLLAPAYGWFTEGFDTRDLNDAKALLEEIDA